MTIALQLLLSIVGSLIAASIIIAIGTFVSKTFRRALTAMAAAFLGVEIKFVYKNGMEAEPAIQEALSSASSVRIFTGRGNEFQRNLYHSVIDGISGVRPETRILLPNPEPHDQHIDWIAYREQELEKVDRAFGRDTLRKQIANNLDFLSAYVEPGKFRVRRFDLPHFGRLILTDDDLFLTPYSETRHGRHCKVLRFGRGEIYNMFSRMFEMLWLDSAANELAPASRTAPL